MRILLFSIPRKQQKQLAGGGNNDNLAMRIIRKAIRQPHSTVKQGKQRQPSARVAYEELSQASRLS
jgi:hypothetical protein